MTGVQTCALPIFFDSQPVASIGSLAVAASDPNTVWAGTGESFIRSHISVGQGIYKSTDGGKTWSLVGLEKTGRIGRVVRWQRFRLYHATETGIPHAVFTFEGERLDLAFDWTVQLNLDVANLRKRQSATQLEPALRIGEGVVAALGTKARKPRHLSTLTAKEKGLEGFVDAAQHILQNLTVNRTNILSNGFDVWELIRLLYVVDALAVRQPGDRKSVV